MSKHNAARGCDSLVTQAHHGIKGKARSDEIRKCKADPETYNKAAGY